MKKELLIIICSVMASLLVVWGILTRNSPEPIQTEEEKSISSPVVSSETTEAEKPRPVVSSETTEAEKLRRASLEDQETENGAGKFPTVTERHRRIMNILRTPEMETLPNSDIPWKFQEVEVGIYEAYSNILENPIRKGWGIYKGMVFDYRPVIPFILAAMENDGRLLNAEWSIIHDELEKVRERAKKEKEKENYEEARERMRNAREALRNRIQ